VITTPNDVVMVMEYAGEELFTYIVETGKGGVSHICDATVIDLIVPALIYRCQKRTRAGCSSKSLLL
jgi:carbon catabolite-derepressing protein kinase